MKSNFAEVGPAAAEADAFAAVISQVSEARWPLETAMAQSAAADGPDDADLWATLVEAGATVVGLAEGLGGLGAGPIGGSAVIAAAARSLQPGALLATGGFAVGLLNAMIDTDAQELAIGFGERLANGARAAVAFAPELAATGSQGPRGVIRAVLDADVADVIFVVAGTDESTEILALDPSTVVQIDRVTAYDSTRRYGDVHVDLGATRPDAVLLRGTQAAVVAEKARTRAMTAVAADAVGGASRAIDEAVAYAKEREQFGRPIGSFQALRHILVDAHVQVSQAGAAMRAGARSVVDDSFASRIDVHAAKALASDGYIAAAATCVQALGGIGFTRETPAYLHVQRARADEFMFGNGSWHRARLSELLAKHVPEDW